MALKVAEPHDPKGIRRKCLDRFWDRVDDADGDANQCWEFRGHVANHGYPNFWYISETQLDPETGKPRKRYITAHRFSALIEPRLGTKINAQGACVMHHCDNKTCVNPNHLTVGTQKDNIHDMLAKGRENYVCKKGSENGRAKLTELQVREMRSLYVPGVVTYREIGEQYNVSEDSVRYAITKGWKHVK